MSCLICCEKLNNSNRKAIQCHYCRFEVCRSCMQTFVTDADSGNDPCCMSPDCKRPWLTEFVETSLTKAFMATKYKQHREKVLFDRETSLMPFTQNLIVEQKVLVEIDKTIARLNDMLIAAKDKRLTHLNICKGSTTATHGSDVAIACPATGCNGFVTQLKYECGICDSKVCRACREIKEETHVCNEDTVASVKLMKKDTKPCPGCAYMIFKIDGCDQMWCVGCKATFSWKTGNLVDTSQHRIHNPHYFEMLRQQNNGEIPRNAGMPVINQCRHAFPDPQQLMRLLGKLGVSESKAHVLGILRSFIHTEQFIDWTFRTPRVTAPERVNLDIRTEFLLGNITEKQFTVTLRNRENKSVRTKDFRELAETYIQIAKDTFTEHVYTNATREDISTLVVKLLAARSYLNLCMQQKKVLHNVKVMHIDDEWMPEMV